VWVGSQGGAPPSAGEGRIVMEVEGAGWCYAPSWRAGVLGEAVRGEVKRWWERWGVGGTCGRTRGAGDGAGGRGGRVDCVGLWDWSGGAA